MIPWTIARQAPPSMGFSRQEYWSGLLFPSPGDLPDPGTEPGSPVLQADALPSEPPGKTQNANSTRCRPPEALSHCQSSCSKCDEQSGLEARAKLDQAPRICWTRRTHENSRDKRRIPASHKPSWKRMRKLSLLQRQTAPSRKEFPTLLGCGLGEWFMLHDKAVCSISGQENTALR